MKLYIDTGVRELPETVSRDTVKDIVSKVKSYIQVWHRQDEENIYNCPGVDWDGAEFVCRMKDGTRRFAHITLDEGMDGVVNQYFDFDDLPEGTEYKTSDIDMWCRLPWNSGLYIDGVDMDGETVQKGPQEADRFKDRTVSIKK